MGEGQARSDERFSRYSFASIMNRSWRMTADIVVPQKSSDGAIVAQGSRLNGWGLVMLNDKPTFMNNASILDRYRTRIAGSEALKPSAHQITVAFAYDGGKRGAGATVQLLVYGEQAATGRISRTIGALMASEGGASIARDYGTTLSAEYASPFTYPGDIRKIVIDLKPTPQVPNENE